MKNELVKIEYNQDQIALIKSQIAPKANNDELKLFLYQCQRTGLDALSRQIYAIHRWNSSQGREVMSIQTSIDGFRVIAERSGDYAGQDEPDFITDDKGKLICAKVKVYRFRNDQRYCAAVGVAYWDEYVQLDKNGNPSGLWKKMPHVMLSKVAEALALRKAYPQDLSGLYTAEEMNQADQPQEHNYVTQDVTAEYIPTVADIIEDEITDQARDELMRLLNSSTYEGKVKDKLFAKINGISKWDEFDKAKQNLLQNQIGIDGIVNPSQRDINKHLKKAIA